MDYFKYTVVDEDAGAAEATVTIDVLPPSQEPKNPNKDTKSGNGGGGLLFWETFFFMLIYLLRISAGSVQKVK